MSTFAVLPSVLHGQAEVRRYRRPGRAVQQEIRRHLQLPKDRGGSHPGRGGCQEMKGRPTASSIPALFIGEFGRCSSPRLSAGRYRPSRAIRPSAWPSIASPGSPSRRMCPASSPPARFPSAGNPSHSKKTPDIPTRSGSAPAAPPPTAWCTSNCLCRSGRTWRHRWFYLGHAQERGDCELISEQANDRGIAFVADGGRYHMRAELIVRGWEAGHFTPPRCGTSRWWQGS